MSYSAEISRANPSCFLFIIDQSGSMSDSFGAGQGTKAKAVADAINRFFDSLGMRCVQGEEIFNYFDVGVIGYGGGGVGSVFANKAEVFNPIEQIYPNRLREEEFPVWFDPKSDGGTPMCQALEQAYKALETWIKKHPQSFPPTVINITDGASTDGDPTTTAEKIKNLETKDGKVLLCNLHISSSQATPIAFPDSDTKLPDQYGKLLFNLSVTLPGPFIPIAQNQGFDVTSSSKLFAFNADAIKLIQFLDIGTRRQIDSMR